MTDEGAKVLAEAIKLLAQAIELATAGSGMAPKGIHVYHHGQTHIGGAPSWPTQFPNICGNT